MAATIGKATDQQYLDQTLQKGNKPITASAATNQPTLQDFINEAQKIGQTSVQAQADIMRNDTKQIGEDLSRQLYGQNVGSSGIGNQVIGQAIETQQKRLEPYAVQVGAATAQQALQQKYDRATQAIQLAVSGNLTGQGAQDIVTAAFGQGAQLTNKDQQDLENAAKASGLTPEEFALMKRAIGTAQWDDIQANPQDYVESPEKIRQFQLELAQLQADAAIEAANIQAGATKDAANTGLLGDVLKTGGTIGTAFLLSDERLKKDIRPISSAIELIKKINPIKFKWKKDDKQDIGVLAQELETAIPELVDNEGEYKKVNYTGLFSILLKAVQELIVKVEGGN